MPSPYMPCSPIATGAMLPRYVLWAILYGFPPSFLNYNRVKTAYPRVPGNLSTLLSILTETAEDYSYEASSHYHSPLLPFILARPGNSP
jgi:hypothetical protein